MKYEAWVQFHDNEGLIIKTEFLEEGFVDCKYIPEIIEFESATTQIDLKGPIFIYDNCKILKNFGPIKRNQKFKTILLDYNVNCVHIDFGKEKQTTRVLLRD